MSESRPGGGTVSTSYDGHDRLLTYNRTGSEAQTNAYNGLDDRVKVTAKFGANKASTRTYVYDPDGRLLGEYGASATAPVAETIWLSPEVANDNQPFGGGDGIGGYAPLAVATGSGASAALYWAHGNHMGVPLVTTNASGAVATPPAYTMAGFPGQTKTLSDIYYNRYRDYDSSLGRYIQADPIGLGGGHNPFLYAEANPLRFMDPHGLDAIMFNYVGFPVGIGGWSFPLGHMGAAAVDPNGDVFYYDFGLYGGPCGRVRGPYWLGRIVYDKDGRPTKESLTKIGTIASGRFGANSPTEVYYDRRPSDEVFAYAEERKALAQNCRRPYKIYDNCKTFAMEAFGLK